MTFTAQKNLNYETVLFNLFSSHFISFLSNDLRAQWIQTAGPTGGNVNAVLVCGDYLFASISGDGIYRSNKTQIHWEKVNNGLDDLNVNCLGRFDAVLFAGTNSGIFKSTDFGNSWMNQTSQVSSPVSSFASDTDEIYAACYPFIFHSINGGITWTSLTNSSFYFHNDLLLKNDTIYTACNDFLGTSQNWGVRVSYNHGLNWSSLNNGLNNQGTQQIAAIGNKLFVGIADSGFFVSMNNGNSWYDPSGGTFRPDVFDLVSDDTILFMASNHGLFRSNDFGSSWVSLNILPEYSFPQNLFLQNDSLYLALYYSGLLRYSIADSSSYLIGLPKKATFTLVDNDSIIICSSEGSQFDITKDDGNSWNPLRCESFTGYGITQLFFLANTFFLQAVQDYFIQMILEIHGNQKTILYLEIPFATISEEIQAICFCILLQIHFICQQICRTLGSI